MLIFDNVFVASEAGYLQVTFAEKSQMKIIFLNKNAEIKLIFDRLDKALKNTAVNYTSHSITMN